MKKALVILMALAMVFSAFADDPTLEPAFKDFKGSASLGYKADLEKEEFGMTNSAAAEITFSFAGEAKKATEGSGIWGELEIKSAAEKCLDTTSVSVEKAVIHFGSVFAIDVKNHGVALGKDGPDFVTGDFSAKTAEIAAAKTNKKDDKGNVVYKTETVTVKDDFVIPATATAAAVPFEGKWETTRTLATAEQTDVFTNGFTALVTLDKIADISVAVADNGVVGSDAKEIAVKGALDVKAVDNLTLKGAVAYNADADDGIAFEGKLGYALGDLSITAAYDQDGDAKSFGAGVLYKWGADYSNDKFTYFTGNGDEKKNFTSGASAAVTTTDFSTFAAGVAAFDNATFVKGLIFGAEFISSDVAALGDNAWAAANAIYSTGVGDFTVGGHAGLKYTLSDSSVDFKYGASVENKALIQNTNLKLGYEGGKDNAGTIEASATISF